MIAFYPTLGDTEKDSFVLMDSCQMFRMHSDETNNAFYSLVRDYDLEWNKSIDMNLVLRKEDDADTLYGNILLHKVIDVEYVLYSILSIIIDKRLVNENYLASSVFQPMQNTFHWLPEWNTHKKKCGANAYLVGGSGKTLKRISNTPHPYGKPRRMQREVPYTGDECCAVLVS